MTEETRFAELEESVGAYLTPSQVEKVRRAYRFSEKAHRNQQRISGEPYIHHPLAVSRILGDMHLDYQTISAAILHDVIEDTDVAKEDIRRRFGRDVAQLVDGVTKISRIQFDNYAHAQASNLQRMFMAMTDDLRVILIKLADRIHNMRTLGALPPAKRRRIACETLEIYAPIAQRLGMNSVRLELEELGFRYFYPLRFQVLEKRMHKIRRRAQRIVARIQQAIEHRLLLEGIESQVLGREKHLYGIYRKMQNKHLSFGEICDLHAFRIVAASPKDCYLALGAIHNLYKPVPGKFKDYIALPKTNGYQSLHTVLFGPHGMPVEVQIRTHDMDRIAEAGIAAHWSYKSGGIADRRGAYRQARKWLRDILELHRAAGDPEEFLEHVRVDLFPEEVYLFTPRGDILKLPRGATVLDMAYAVHTDVGNRCVGARVDRQPAPLSSPLKSGQTVEILTSPFAQPDPAWLKFVTTAKARAGIRHYLRGIQLSEARDLGKRLLQAELAALAMSYEQLGERDLRAVLEGHGLDSRERLLEETGVGNLPAHIIARELSAADGKAAAADGPAAQPLVIEGTEGMAISFARCCHPIPGDAVSGYASPDRGIVIHRRSCKNMRRRRRRPERLICAEWAQQLDRDFVAVLQMQVANQRGVLATVASAIADQGINVINVGIKGGREERTTLQFALEIRDRKHLAQAIRRIRRLGQVSRIERTGDLQESQEQNDLMYR